MQGQISIFEAFPGVIEPPELWECMKTCARANIYTDQFPLGGKRCIYGQHMDHSTGNDLIQKVKDNFVHIYCKYYKPKEDK